MQTQPPRFIPIYTSRGDLGALLVFPFLYNPQGEWIGWVTRERQVYSVLGNFVGVLNSDARIVRRPSDEDKPQQTPPPTPPRIKPPASVPLASMMSDLTFGIVDVLMEMPELLHTIDYGELKQDLD